MKRRLIIHPLVLAVYPVSFLISRNIGQFSFSQTLFPLVIILALTTAGWFLLNIFIKNRAKSAIIVSLFLFLFFSYGHFTRQLCIKKVYAIPVWIILIGFVSYLTIKQKSPNKITTILNVTATVLVLLCMPNIIRSGLLKSWEKPHDTADTKTSPNQTDQTNPYPDIYFILLDAYARADILQQMYDYDNFDFLDFLKEKGFYIAHKSTSNYCQTCLSIGSCFNLCYLDEFVKYLGKKNPSRRPLKTFIENSLLTGFLRERNYKIVSIATNCSKMGLQNADIYLESGISINLLWNALMNLTPISDITVLRKNNQTIDRYRKDTLDVFDTLAEIANVDQAPKFVFGYIVLPHPPFVFGSDGEPVKSENTYSDHDADWLIRKGRMTPSEYRTYYLDQLIFVNKRMKTIVGKILSQSEQPPVILILADHGPRSEMFWSSAEKTNVKECMSILNAYHLPDGGDKLLYPEITPVNSFRVIFNHYFDADFKLLDDRNYFSTAKYPYLFEDVTERCH